MVVVVVGAAVKEDDYYWAHLHCWISPCYGPFLLGAHFETYEPFIYLIFNFCGGCSKLQMITLNQLLRGHTCMLQC
jgi:hypothetical protein